MNATTDTTSADPTASDPSLSDRSLSDPSLPEATDTDTASSSASDQAAEIDSADGRWVLSETMDRPWRLGVVASAVAIGLCSRLAAVNDLADADSDRMMHLHAAVGTIAAIGMLMVAAERDRFPRTVGFLALLSGVAGGVLQWISPHFAPRLVEWDDGAQLALTALGFGNGLLIAGVLALAFVRRPPTLSTLLMLTAAALTLTANSVLLHEIWASIVTLVLAFGAVLLAWDRAPRHEPLWVAASGNPRVSRAALSLCAMVLAGSAIQIWISRGRPTQGFIGEIVVAGLVIAASLVVIGRLRREIQRRSSSLSEWRSLMREIRTGDLQREFARLGTTADGGLIGDLEAEPLRPLSFPDLHPDSHELDDGDSLLPTPSGAFGNYAMPTETMSTETMSTETLPTETVPTDEPPATTLPAFIERHTGTTIPPVTAASTAEVPSSHVPTTAAAFSSRLDPRPAPTTSSLDDLADWVLDPLSEVTERVVVAVESLRLPDFEQLDASEAQSLIDTLAIRLSELAPTPNLIVPVDGPYVLVAWNHLPDRHFDRLNMAVLSLIDSQGAHAFLCLNRRTTLDALLDDAVAGLVVARRSLERGR